MKQNWKVLKGLMGKNKKTLHKEFIVDGVSTNDTTKHAMLSVIISLITQEISMDLDLISTSHHLDQIEIIERSMYFRIATKPDIMESIMRLN